MRYLLDTNILIYILGDSASLSTETQDIINNSNNLLFTSAINILELVQLYNVGKIKSKIYKSAAELTKAIEKDYYIEILPFSKSQCTTLSTLRIASLHNDPFDHAIISHAITDKLNLISSDKKFTDYKSQKLIFSFNKK